MPATRKQAYEGLPAGAVWSCSFGNWGEPGFNDHFRAPDGSRWIVSNGPSAGPLQWSCRRVRDPMDRAGIAKRYPRLIRCACWVACLNTSEAVGAIYALKAGSVYAGEAVNHFGGADKVIRRAFAVRRAVRSLRGGRV